MNASMILPIGVSGVGKSMLGCYMTLQGAFKHGKGPIPLTQQCSIRYSLIQDIGYIDTQAINDPDKNDEEILKDTKQFIQTSTLKLSTLILVFNFKSPNFDNFRIQRIIMMYIAMINDVEFLKNVCIVFTHCKKPVIISQLAEWEQKKATLKDAYNIKFINCIKEIYGKKFDVIKSVQGGSINCFFVDSKRMDKASTDEIKKLHQFVKQCKPIFTADLYVPDHARLKITDVKTNYRKLNTEKMYASNNGAYSLIEEVVHEEANIWECYDSSFTVQDDYKIINRSKREASPQILKQWSEPLIQISQTQINSSTVQINYQKVLHTTIKNPDKEDFTSSEVSVIIIRTDCTEKRETKKSENKIQNGNAYDLVETFAIEERVVSKWSNQMLTEDGNWKEIGTQTNVTKAILIEKYEDEWAEKTRVENNGRIEITMIKLTHLRYKNPDEKQVENIETETKLKILTEEIHERLIPSKVYTGLTYTLNNILIREKRIVTDWNHTIIYGKWVEFDRTSYYETPKEIVRYDDNWTEISREQHGNATHIVEATISHIIMENPDRETVDVQSTKKRTKIQTKETRKGKIYEEKKVFGFKGHKQLYQLVRIYGTEEQTIIETDGVQEQQGWKEVSQNEETVKPILKRTQRCEWAQESTEKVTCKKILGVSVKKKEIIHESRKINSTFKNPDGRLVTVLTNKEMRTREK